jgi:disulfide bond formation protein DsbB
MFARLIYLFVLLGSMTLLGLGMYLQYASHLQSCPAQVLVRYALVFTALIALVAVAIDAGKIFRVAMSAGIGVVSLLGAVLAVQLSWPRTIPFNLGAVGLDPGSVIRSLPLSDVMPKFFLGAGACENTRWKLIGIAGPEWALGAFVLFILAAFFAARRG